ncbi:hypothetical protein OIU77_025177 [Salix suchowensis]|uniref:Uncharacterized protein n=1 Tax=Salix suchowensis TaxID=1278906 RepID=A0ABQ9BY69_9ROSI|nr:hypothetical protein OIU77_025177 [Salix suchowensis]
MLGSSFGVSRDIKTEPKRQRRLGGNRAALFVFAMEGLENMTFISMAVSLVTYFLDRAVIAKTTNDAPTSISHGPWRLCTVTQVEETKILIRMVPITLSTVFMNTCLAQLQTFSVQQSITVDTRVFGLQVPGPHYQ